MGIVVILGDADDLHVTAVTKHLELLRHDSLVTGIGENFGLAAFDLTSDVARIRLDNNWLLRDDITAVWDRARSSIPILEDEAWQYAFRERKAFIESLHAFATAARWMNPLQSSVLASNKISQLLAARAVGLQIPATLVTNDSATVKELAQENEWQLIFKALSWLATVQGETLFTTELTPSMGTQLGAGLRAAPCIFQRRVAKEYELRVTAVGETFFAARINSQQSNQARLDWRRDEARITYSIESLPPDVLERLRGVLDALGLNFGTFDLAVTPAGEFIFFEINPAGNWLWLEDALGLPISAQVAAWLTGA
jgi:glutathione synthase/RimK-type ligase-like ATP-grasp enzyme